MDKPVIYTIGHSTHQLDYFLDLLKEYSVNCLVDVRSIAASSYNPQYNKEPLSDFLRKHHIRYLHFSKEFGARQNDAGVLDEEGKVDFEKVRESRNFKRGIERLWQGIEKRFTIALMCSESDPLDCHRFSMVARALASDGFDVRHILRDKTITSNTDLEAQLLKRYAKKLLNPDMFEPNVTLEDRLKIAYRLRNKEIAYSPYVQ